jgi:hypothetical protein
MWCVFRCRVGSKDAWAWCWNDGEPGWEKVVLTTPDGLEPFQGADGDTVRFGTFLFYLPGPVGPDETPVVSGG